MKNVEAIDTGKTHLICGIPVHVYTYPSYAKNTLIYTPAGVHTTYSENYEGPHHPMCKIELFGYLDYDINEGGVKLNGKKIFSTKMTPYKRGILNDNLLLGILVACFYSLSQRLDFYIHLIEDLGKTIDHRHNQAPIYTIDIIDRIFDIIERKQVDICAHDFMNSHRPLNLKEIVVLFEQINYYSDDLSQQRKEWILDFYHSKKFKSPPNFLKEKTKTAKRLF